jgi:hypothetical protein
MNMVMNLQVAYNAGNLDYLRKFFFILFFYFPLRASLLISNSIPTMTAMFPIYIHLFWIFLARCVSLFSVPLRMVCMENTETRRGKENPKKVNINWKQCSHSWYIVRYLRKC